MWSFKYYDGIRAAQQSRSPSTSASAQDFDLDRPQGRLNVFVGSLVSRSLPLLFWFFRTFWPNPQFGRLVLVTREADVRQVLTEPDVFEVPFALEMTELGGGTNSVLGMEGEEHDQLNTIIRAAIRKGDLDLVRDHTRRVADALLANAGGRIDVIGDLITRCATEACAKYFGLRVDDPTTFADWTVAISAMLFADPFGAPETRRRAVYAADRLKTVVDRAIADAKLRASGGAPADALVDRFLQLKAAHPDLTDGTIRATLIGLMTGFIPTNTLAAGKMLDELLRRPDAMQKAVKAADADDRAALTAILLEAARLNPALSPGQWRYARKDGTIADGTPRAKRVREGSVVLVATASALRDRRAIDKPRQFMLRSDQSTDLLFGAGPHWCLGKYVATAQITEVFLALLAQADLRRAPGPAGRLRSAGAFPRQLDMLFTPKSAPAGQSMITVCAPLAVPTEAEALRKQIRALGNPAGAAFAQDLTATGIVHFASLAVIELGNENQAAPHLLLELNVDGPQEAALKAVTAAAESWLGPIFTHVRDAPPSLLEAMTTYALEARALPWGATGLNFNGTPEFPVAEIGRQAELAMFARDAIDHYLQDNVAVGAKPMATLDHVRNLIRQDERLVAMAQADPRTAELLARGAKLADLLFRPMRRRLLISEWTESGAGGALARFASSRAAWPLYICAGGLLCLLIVAVYAALAPETSAQRATAALLAVPGGIVAEVILLGLLALAFTLLLRYHESRDIPDERRAELAHLRAATALEDAPGYAQNHFMAVTTLKQGWFRRLTLASALWGIKQLVTFAYRPGFVVDMGSIHYARWVCVPGSDKMIFLANYDGSWDSYLEDFVTKAHAGQTAAWSNCVGFPRTRFLIGEGARDGDRFKRWVRRQQVPSQFWYSRFPKLTTDRIRSNALVHDGLVRARTDSSARAWLACFGSVQRPEFAIESDEVQALVFGGFGRLRHGTCALLRLPTQPSERQDWLTALALDQTIERSYLRSDLAIMFGDMPAGDRDSATFVAFSAAGLRKLGLAGDPNSGPLATFPGAFNIGMAGRAQVLGDFESSAPTHWRWSDGEGEGGVDAALLIYARSAALCSDLLDKHVALLGGAERAVVRSIHMQPIGANEVVHEHFGFRDGISQPIIRGTQRFVKGALPNDVAEPGEFILGYRNNQGYFPPSPVVGAESDLGNRLPTLDAETPARFPAFTSSPAAMLSHDFGRNGTFLVLRQLKQDVDGFRTFTDDKAKELRRYYRRDAATSAKIDADWVAAKMMGRWQDGTPLVDAPLAPPAHPRAQPNNDFAFGLDDPSGLRCPLGAHIRRANPRDSFQPGEAVARSIVNRHRLLRRGRPYEVAREAAGEPEKGLLFACLCADIERQFEFVQQSWLNSPSFHGLHNEADPIVSATASAANVFTIPTPSGALTLNGMQSYITTMAGGYFFMPSRSSLRYLVDISMAGSSTGSAWHDGQTSS